MSAHIPETGQDGKGDRASLLSSLSRAKPTQPGETYGVPGSGETRHLTIATVVILLFAWWLVTTLGWVSHLFLPSPQDIVRQFIVIWDNGFTGTPLWQHILVSSWRVLLAFILACLFGILSDWPSA